MSSTEHSPGPRPRRVFIAGEAAPWPPRALSVIIRPLFARGFFQGMGRLTTVGRRTSKPRRHAVRAVRNGNRAFLVSIPGDKAAWILNIRTNPRVKFETRGLSTEGVARELEEGPERDEAREVFVGTVNIADYFECFLHWQGLPRRWKIEKLHELWFERGTPVRIDLDS